MSVIFTQILLTNCYHNLMELLQKSYEIVNCLVYFQILCLGRVNVLMLER